MSFAKNWAYMIGRRDAGKSGGCAGVFVCTNCMDKILCVGLVVVDIITRCEKYPVEDSDERCEWISLQRGGNASNNCTIINQFDHSSEYFGTLCNDWISNFIIKDLEASGIGFSKCVIYKNPEMTSPCSSVILNLSNGSRTIRHHNPNLPELSFKDFEDKFRIEHLINYDWIHFEGRRKNLDQIVLMLRYISEALPPKTTQTKTGPLISVEMEKVSSVLGPALLPLPLDVYFIGKDYAKSQGYNDMLVALKSIRRTQLELRQSLDMKHSRDKALIVITWGEMGSAALISTSNFEEDDFCVLCPLPSESIASTTNFTSVSGHELLKPKVLDTLGAGDTFIATFIHCYLWITTNTYSTTPWRDLVESALKYSNYVAGLKCRQIGLENIPIQRSLHDFLP